MDVANDCIITAEDCGTKRGVTVQAEIDGGQVVASLTERVLGRTTAEDIKHPETGEVLVKRNKEVTEDLAEKIEARARPEGARPFCPDLRSAGRGVR